MIYTQIPLAQEISMLETERLWIRVSPEACYAQALNNLSREALKVWLGITDEGALDAEKQKIAGGLTTYRTSLVFFHLINKATDVVMGSFAFHNWYPLHRRSEIGYIMTQEASKNQGFMKEAVPVILDFGFREMNLNRIEAFIHPNNLPSQKLVRANGFQREGQLAQHYFSDGAYGDSIVFGKLRQDQ